MTINEKTYAITGSLATKSATRRIILHHAASSNCTVDDIQKWHLAAGYACIGYHFVIYKDGSIWRGRPQNTVGAHAQGANSDSIGICFVGNFESETMGDAQKQAGKELVAKLKSDYGISTVQKHKDVVATACPGANFPFDEIAGASSNTGGSNTRSKTSNTGSLLKYGSNGSEVTALQNKLQSLGYNVGKIDGIFGTNTQAAVRAFQSNNGLSVDGIVGDKTRAALNGSPTGAGSSTTSSSGGYKRLLKLTSPNMSGDDVKQVQSALNHKGFSVGNVDGFYGAKTEAAVRSFQSENGLSADGQVGPKTWSKLF